MTRSTSFTPRKHRSLRNRKATGTRLGVHLGRSPLFVLHHNLLKQLLPGQAVLLPSRLGAAQDRLAAGQDDVNLADGGRRERRRAVADVNLAEAGRARVFRLQERNVGDISSSAAELRAVSDIEVLFSSIPPTVGGIGLGSAKSYQHASQVIRHVGSWVA